MNKIVPAAVASLSLLACLPAHAGDTRYYAGAATGFSKSTIENSAGERSSSKKHPLPLKLYAGVELTDYLALEAGYSGLAGKYAFDKRLFGTAAEPRLSSRAVYLAAKGSVAVSDAVDLHVKLGLAHSRYALSNAGANDRDLGDTKPMLGIGAAYKLTDRAAVTLELEHYGTVREQQSKLRQGRIQAGIRFGF